MAVTTQTLLQTHDHSRSNGEREIVTRLIQAAAEAGIQADPISVVNFYVALKSKPLAILTGPVQSGKIALVKSLAQVLTGGDPFRYQVMPGHAWWAGQTGNVALFTEAQTRLNTSKILALIDEAWQPENAQRVFIACLSHISPAELLGFFSELAFQLRHGELMRLPGLHLTAPIPYPSNLLLVGTMDTARFDHWSDADLLSMTAVIPWPALSLGQAFPPAQTTMARDGESVFLHACIRSDLAARLKLQRILGWRPLAIRPLVQITDLLKRHAVELSGMVMNEVLIYLANAWTNEGDGLFDERVSRNLVIALDLAIAQTLLPRVSEIIRQSVAVPRQLRAALNGQFPRSVAFLESLD